MIRQFWLSVCPLVGHVFHCVVRCLTFWWRFWINAWVSSALCCLLLPRHRSQLGKLVTARFVLNCYSPMLIYWAKSGAVCSFEETPRIETTKNFGALLVGLDVFRHTSNADSQEWILKGYTTRSTSGHVFRHTTNAASWKWMRISGLKISGLRVIWDLVCESLVVCGWRIRRARRLRSELQRYGGSTGGTFVRSIDGCCAHRY